MRQRTINIFQLFTSGSAFPHRLCLHVVFIVRFTATASHSFETSMNETRFSRILPIEAKNGW